MKKFFAFLIMFLFVSFSAEGSQEFNPKEIREKAMKGDAQSQYNLGVMYRNGEGVKQNDKEAVKWYLKAVENGNDKAQNNLARLYLNGQGVEENYDEAVRLLKLSAAQ